jgi:hypothetical protein
MSKEELKKHLKDIEERLDEASDRLRDVEKSQVEGENVFLTEFDEEEIEGIFDNIVSAMFKIDDIKELLP